MNLRGKHGTHRAILFLLPLLALASCGGEPGKDVVSSGTGVGPVSGFGSVIVNGVKYNVDNTTFVDAHGRTLDNLAAGMWVKVTGSSINDNPTSPAGVATRMEVQRLADGPVNDNSVSIDNNSFRLLGQSVFVGLTTVFDNVADLFAIDNLVRQGNLPEIEIHGSTDDTGFLRADYVHLWSDNLVSGRQVQLKGTVRNLNRTDNAFAIGPLLQKVDYGGVPSVPSGLDNGVFVAVGGTYRGSDNAILAISIRLEDPASGQNPGDLAKAEGYVNRLLADLGNTRRFELIAPDGLQVVNWSTGTTSFRDGAASDVVAGARVQVEGSRNQDKTLAVKRISFRKPCNIRVESTVTAKTTSSISVKVLGLNPVSVNLLTTYKDSTGKFPGAFGLGDIKVNNTVRVDAFLDTTLSSGQIVATRVELRDQDPIQFNRHILQGPVDSSPPPNLPFFSILGIKVQTFSDIRTSYLQVDGSDFPPGPLQRFNQQVNFFDVISAAPAIVKVRGTYGTSTMEANEVQIQPTADK